MSTIVTRNKYVASKLNRKTGEHLPFATKALFSDAVAANPAIVLLTPQDAKKFRGYVEPWASNGTYEIVGPFGEDPSWTATLIINSGTHTVI